MGAARGALIFLIAFVVIGCGGDEGKEKQAPPKPKAAASAQQFADRFEPITGQQLEMANDTFGTRMNAPDEPDRFVRYGEYTLVWTKDENLRKIVLGKDAKPDADGIYWTKLSGSWSLAKPYGPHLVLQWVGEKEKRTTPVWDRIDRAVNAAYTGDTGALLESERPCEQEHLDPLSGPPGQCSVEGIPVTYADAGKPLDAGGIEIEVLGVAQQEEVGAGTVLPQHAKGRFVVVAYKVRNTGDEPLSYLKLGLRLGGKTLESDPGAEVSMPRSRSFPLAPGQEMETGAVFDVDPDLAETARAKGALVAPAATDGKGHPELDLSQAWTRLAKAPAKLPKAPTPETQPNQPPPAPEPKGPPDIAFKPGSGPPIGGSARRLYMANTYFPIPKDFKAGGVPIGSKAGGCEVPRPAGADVRGLRAAAQKESPEGRVPTPKLREILLADCGSDGRHAILFWRILRKGKGLKLAGDEFKLTSGRWAASSGKRPPGCHLPEAAAAVWQIDISVCDKK